MILDTETTPIQIVSFLENEDYIIDGLHIFKAAWHQQTAEETEAIDWLVDFFCYIYHG